MKPDDVREASMGLMLDHFLICVLQVLLLDASAGLNRKWPEVKTGCSAKSAVNTCQHFRVFVKAYISLQPDAE